jgi:succinoglycan biosynthesis transport protein ExoP
VMLCSFVGVLLGLARDNADSSLKEPGEVNQFLGLPEMGVMLRDSSGYGLLHSPDTQSLKPAPDVNSILGVGQFGRVVNPREAKSGGLWRSLSNPSSNANRSPVLALESCRAVVASLLSSADGNSPRLLVVTSPGPGEGKTTVVANLGLTLALIGKRVLLVDGDVRRHRLHKFFSLHDERGLCSILERDQAYVTALDSYVQKTAVPGLSVLSSGASTTATANLLYSADVPKLLARLKSEYDFVLIDTPPVFPVADARVLGRFADGVILVARAGQTAREAAAAAHRRLAADEVRVLGLILNDWDPKASAHTYYGDYSREYSDVES